MMTREVTNLGTARQTRTTTNKKTSSRPTLTPEQRHRLIEATAYFIAERRGFQGGDPVADWLKAEAEVDSRYGYNA